MKKSLMTIAALAGIATAAVPSTAQAQVSADFEVAALTSYVWRGFTLADAVVIQPSLTFGFGESGLSLNVWGSAAVQDRDFYDGADELDFTLGYDVALSEGLGLSLAYVQYTFPSAAEGAKHSEEVVASLGFDHTLAPSVTAAYDFGLMDGLYLTAGVAPEFALSDDIALGIGASVGLSNYVNDEFGFNDVTLSASLGGLTAGSVAITPFIGFSSADEGINPDSQFWAGLSFGF